jgi:YHS domain-containing protein
VHNGNTVYFCGSGCQMAFTASPDDYVVSAERTEQRQTK